MSRSGYIDDGDPLDYGHWRQALDACIVDLTLRLHKETAQKEGPRHA
jgi:hypothetical protein